MNNLVGKKISATHIDGYGIEIYFTDGTILTYDASDAGYSSWEIKHNCSGCQEFNCSGCEYRNEN